MLKIPTSPTCLASSAFDHLCQGILERKPFDRLNALRASMIATQGERECKKMEGGNG